jgi:hypothetical protein
LKYRIPTRIEATSRWAAGFTVFPNRKTRGAFYCAIHLMATFAKLWSKLIAGGQPKYVALDAAV